MWVIERADGLFLARGEMWIHDIRYAARFTPEEAVNRLGRYGDTCAIRTDSLPPAVMAASAVA